MMDSPKSVEQLRNWMEQQVRQVFPVMGDSACNKSGIPYITLELAGLKEEGEPVRLIATDKKTAIEFFAKAFRQHVVDLRRNIEGDMVLHWRKFPELVDTTTGWVILSRFVITGV